jgi:hypothetical protein
MSCFGLGSVAESEQVKAMALGPARGSAERKNQLSGVELVKVMLNFSGGRAATMRVEAIDSGAPTPTLQAASL